MTTIDTDENLGLGLRQALKCGRVKPVTGSNPSLFLYLKIAANKIKTKTDNKKRYFIEMML